MKVLEISGCNLASIKGEFRIPLDQPPFSREGLFAIRGVTGSGKSTLIDAVCLALYDDAPRFAGKGGPEIGFVGQKDRLKATDPRSILHRGTAYGWAEAVFRGVDGARWRARWSVTRARKRADGKFQSQEMELENLDTFERPGGTRTEVLEHIREKVGLSFDQFKRSVLLAQGEFAAFVKADEKDRADLLEAMTGTDIYARISRAAQQRSVQEDRNLETLHTERDALGLLSEEARSEKDTKAKNLGKQIEQRDKEQAETRRNLDWHTQYTKLKQQCIEATEKATHAKTVFDNAEPRRIQLEKVERAQTLRPLYDALALKREDHASLEANIKNHQVLLPNAEQKQIDSEQTLEKAQKALAESVKAVETAKPDLDKVRVLDANIQTALDRHNQLTEEYSRLNKEALAAENAREETGRELNRLSDELKVVDAELKQSDSLKDLVRLWPRVEKDIEDFAVVKERLRAVQKELSATCQSASAQEKIRDSLRKDLDDTKADLSDRQNELASLEQQIARDPRELLDSTRNANQSTVNQLRVAEGILQRLHPLLSQLQAAENEAKTQASAKDQAHENIETASRELLIIEARLQEARSALERARSAQSLEDRRSQLEDRQPCPLCGSLEHPWAQGSPLTGLLETQNHQVLDLDRRRTEIDQTRTRAHTQMIQAEKAETKARKDAKDCTDKLQKEETDWQNARALRAELPEDARSPLVLSQVLDHIKIQEECLADIGKRESVLLKLEKQAEIFRKKIRKIEGLKSDLDEKILVATETLQLLEVNKAAHTKDVENLGKKLTTHRESLKAVLDSDSLIELDRNPQALRTGLAERVEKRQAAEASKVELTQLSVESVKKLEGLQAKADEKRSAASNAEAKQDGSAKTLETLRNERRSYFEGRSIAEIEQELETKRKVCEASAEQAKTDFQTADQAVLNLKQTISTLKAQQVQAESAIHSARQAFDDASAQRWGDDLESLEACLKWNPEQIRTERGALQILETECSKAEAVLNAHQKALDDHSVLERPAQTQEELERFAATVKDILNTMKLELGGVQADLQRDDQARLNAEKLNLKIQEQQSRTALWKEMNELVGSSDGKKFRNFAQSLTLETLLAFANDQLTRLTPRYRLQRVPGYELELQVIDQDMGDEIRALNSLSGGETFLVSLALALGLSSLSASDTPIDSLFIDEGFGTLDPETLETALSALDELQSQGRQVGIVSHVDGLAAHIPVQIETKKLGGGISKVVLPCRRSFEKT